MFGDPYDGVWEPLPNYMRMLKILFMVFIQHVLYQSDANYCSRT